MDDLTLKAQIASQRAMLQAMGDKEKLAEALARAEAAEAKLAAAIETAAAAALLCGEWEGRARKWRPERDAALARAEAAEAKLAAIPSQELLRMVEGRMDEDDDAIIMVWVYLISAQEPQP